MSIAGDTQARVPGFYSAQETVISPRKSGLAWQIAQNPGVLTQPTASGPGAISIGNNVAFGINSIIIGNYTNATANIDGSVLIGNTSGQTSSAGNCVAIGNGSRGSNDGVAIGTNAAAAGPKGSGASLENFNVAIGGNAEAGSQSNNSYSSRTIAIGSSAVSGGATGSTGSGNSVRSGIAIGNSANSRMNTNSFSVNRGGIAIGESANTLDLNSIAFGHLSSADFHGELNFGLSNRFSVAGDCKSSLLIMWQETNGATPTLLGMNNQDFFNTSTPNPSQQIVLTNDSSYLFDFDIIARNTATDTQSKAWNLKFAIRRGINAANTAIIGTPTIVIYGEDTGTTTWAVTAIADTTNGRPNIQVTGEVGKSIRWVANGRMTKVRG